MYGPILISFSSSNKQHYTTFNMLQCCSNSLIPIVHTELTFIQAAQ